MAQSELINLVRTVVSYPRTTGLTADTQTNTFYVGSDVETDRDDIAAVAGGMVSILTAAMDSLMSSDMFVSPCLVEYFDMLEPEPRIPFVGDDFPLSMNASDESLPLEASMCMSFEGIPLSGVNQQRRRGRLYLPTFVNTITEMASGRVRWTAAQLTALATAGDAMKAHALANNCSWTVYSPKTASETAGSLLDKARAASTYVLRGWLDTEPDIQRRRGGPGGVKTTWT